MIDVTAKRTHSPAPAIFVAIVLTLAVAAALAISRLALPQLPALVLWGSTPAIAVLIMGGRRGWRTLGLHRLGVRLWWIAAGMTLLTSVLATAVVWATPIASFVRPASPLSVVLNLVVGLPVTVVTFAIAEEVAWRGYLLPRLLPLGRNRALALTGLVHAVWHLPLVLLTTLYHADGNRLITVPLLLGTVVAAGFVFGDLRIATGSVWPAAIAHATHNVAWGALQAFTVTASPVLVNEYLVGDNGVLILVATVVGAVWLRSWLHRSRRW